VDLVRRLTRWLRALTAAGDGKGREGRGAARHSYGHSLPCEQRHVCRDNEDRHDTSDNGSAKPAKRCQTNVMLTLDDMSAETQAIAETYCMANVLLSRALPLDNR
jgi:hypothetical protein